MFASDRETFQSLQLLDTEVKAQRRPLVVWVGAGVSAWAGYPLWNDLAAQMHTMFSRSERGYDASRGTDLLNNERLPDLFQLMRDCSSKRYFSELADRFKPSTISPVYQRFIQTLEKIAPHRILTTNVDESLERHLAGAVLLQRSDFERAVTLLHTSSSFVCKLHGSISMAASTIFTAADYTELSVDANYLRLLREIFANSNVLFLGYGVRDDYVVQTLLEAVGERQLFGAGEHFVVCPEEAHVSSSHLRAIRYVVTANGDHRACLQALDLILAAKSIGPEPTCKTTICDMPTAVTSYFIADLIPPGTWQTSQTIRVRGAGEVEREMLVGTGYIDGEVQVVGYSAMHDIVVGLLCFDKIYFTLGALGKVHSLLGSDVFWRLFAEDAIGIVHSNHDTALIYAAPGAVSGGDLGSIELLGPGADNKNREQMTLHNRIRRALTAVPGKEEEAERLFERLTTSVVVLPENNIPDKVRGALVHPSVRRLLGVSGGTSSSAIPRWVAFPILRLADVISTAEYCQHLNAVATRLLWGSEQLASAAFSVAAGQEWADDAAGYVLTGHFNTNVGAMVERNPEMLARILAFRASPVGESFRREVAARLATNDGGELVASVNAGLRQSLPSSLLERARDQFSGLFVPRERLPRMTPAVWGDVRNGDQRIFQWRAQSRKLLNEACLKLKIGPYDQCPCGSGEKLRFCCQEALRQ